MANASAELYARGIITGASNTAPPLPHLLRGLRKLFTAGQLRSFFADTGGIDVGASILIEEGPEIVNYSFIHGYDQSLARIFELLFDYRRRGGVVMEVCLKTAAELDVRTVLYGGRGKGIGNPRLLGALLHDLVQFLGRNGIRSLRCEPQDDRLRSFYQVMGFQRGEVLDLRDETSLMRIHRVASHLRGA